MDNPFSDLKKHGVDTERNIQNKYDIGRQLLETYNPIIYNIFQMYADFLEIELDMKEYLKEYDKFREESNLIGYWDLFDKNNKEEVLLSIRLHGPNYYWFILVMTTPSEAGTHSIIIPEGDEKHYGDTHEYLISNTVVIESEIVNSIKYIHKLHNM